MKKLTLNSLIICAGFVAVSAMAAKEVTQAQVDKMQLQSLGTVDTTAQTSDPMDAKRVLSKLADQKGGKYFRIIAAREGGRVSAIAEVYK